MPFIVWAAIAAAILIIGISAALSVPEVPQHAENILKPVAESANSLLKPLGWGLAGAVILLAVGIIAIRWFRRRS